MDAYEAERAPGQGRRRRGRDRGKGQTQRAWRRFGIRKDSAADPEEIENYKLELAPLTKLRPTSFSPKFKARRTGPLRAWGKDAVHPWEGEINYSLPPPDSKRTSTTFSCVERR